MYVWIQCLCTCESEHDIGMYMREEAWHGYMLYMVYQCSSDPQGIVLKAMLVGVQVVEVV